MAAVILEPVQNAGGCLLPPEGYFDRVREICDEYNVLLISDEVICSWGRLGGWFGSQRHRIPAGHHHHRQRPHQRLRADGRGYRVRPHRRAVHAGLRVVPARRHLGRPSDRRRRGDVNLDVFENEDIIGRVREHEGAFLGMLALAPGSPDRRQHSRIGYFYAIELVKDQETKGSFTDEESETLLRGYLSAEMFVRGLICRSDDRGDPVIQLSPPLIAGPEQFAEIEAVLRPVLEEAGRRMQVGGQ